MRYAKVDTENRTVEAWLMGTDAVVIDAIACPVFRLSEAARLENDLWPVRTEGEQPPYHLPSGQDVTVDDAAQAVIVTNLFAPMPVDDAVSVLCTKADEIKSRVQGGGFAFTHNDIDYRVACDLESRTDLLGAYSAAQDGAWNDEWTMRVIATGEKAQVSLTSAEMMALGLTALAHHNAVHKAAVNHKAAIRALGAVNDVLAYEADTLPTGWPENPAVASE